MPSRFGAFESQGEHLLAAWSGGRGGEGDAGFEVGGYGDGGGEAGGSGGDGEEVDRSWPLLVAGHPVGLLLTARSGRELLRVWDVERELSIDRIGVGGICALCADPAAGRSSAGCADGWVRVFDRRGSPSPPPGVSVHASDGWAFRPRRGAGAHAAARRHT